MKYLNIRTVIVFTLAIGFATALLHVSQSVQGLEDEKTHLRAEIADYTENMHTLKAEWTYLIAPQNLQQMIEQTGGTRTYKMDTPQSAAIISPTQINDVMHPPQNTHDTLIHQISTSKKR